MDRFSEALARAAQRQRELEEMHADYEEIDVELFTGPAAESVMERAARLGVAHEVLAELRESDLETAAYAESLLRTLPLKTRQSDGRRPRRTVRRSVKGRAAGSAVAA
ncbi:hypothetical protein [Streptomyces sp. NPDC014734]|uniref:hypothetical protein n=1 Tax=Streptomyces sp. NPDC014734 TaxID=3364886 RepID=UPI0036F74EFE